MPQGTLADADEFEQREALAVESRDAVSPAGRDIDPLASPRYNHSFRFQLRITFAARQCESY
jgi:hypothetical protein